MKKDRSGIATILIAVIVVVILAAAACAAYVVLKNEPEEKQTLAPGTVLKYEAAVSGASSVFECSYIGQSKDLYFVELKVPIDETKYTVA